MADDPVKFRNMTGTWTVVHRGESSFYANEEAADARVEELRSRRFCQCGCPLTEVDGGACWYCTNRR